MHRLWYGYRTHLSSQQSVPCWSMSSLRHTGEMERCYFPLLWGGVEHRGAIHLSATLYCLLQALCRSQQAQLLHGTSPREVWTEPCVVPLSLQEDPSPRSSCCKWQQCGAEQPATVTMDVCDKRNQQIITFGLPGLNHLYLSRHHSVLNMTPTSMSEKAP